MNLNEIPAPNIKYIGAGRVQVHGIKNLTWYKTGESLYVPEPKRQSLLRDIENWQAITPDSPTMESSPIEEKTPVEDSPPEEKKKRKKGGDE